VSTATSTGTEPPVGDVELRGFERSLPMALLRGREAIMAHFRPILAAHDLTEQQWRVLRALVDADDSVSVGQLAERTLLLVPSLSRMLPLLERRGLIRRTPGTGDARRVEVAISSRGARLVTTIAPLSEAAYGRITAAVGDEQLTALYELLDRLARLDPA
jgi:homoprotocatechuate degradation regulator HpaR